MDKNSRAWQGTSKAILRGFDFGGYIVVGARRTITVIGWILYVLGAAVWVVGYYVSGHHSVLDWRSFSPTRIAMFLPNLECEIGLLLTILGTVGVYGARLARAERAT
jgi:hypothetical protein